MKQLNFFKATSFKKEHGGSISIGKRKSRRPIATKRPMHLVLKSDLATGHRALTRHRPLIETLLKKAKKKFNIKIYEQAIVYNHLHLLIKGHSRQDIQNFFRVIAGHIAQEILRKHPVKRRSPSVNKFWMCRLYSRLVSWGREFLIVKNYVTQNALESLGVIRLSPGRGNATGLTGMVKKYRAV